MSSEYWPESQSRIPWLVAEQLRAVRNPLAAWLRPPPAAPPLHVAASLARALLPREATDEPPAWLRSDQRLSFRRLVAAVRRHRGALLADGVGSGKTWIALAAARALDPDHPIHLLIPAVLRSQWEAAGRATGLVLRIHSHETLSRGREPAGGAGVVIIDESHRFRTPTIARHRTLAPWCVGRRGILVTATPVVNRLEDLIAQLSLLVRDDALSAWGIAGLESLASAPAIGALAELVITGEDRGQALPARRERVLQTPRSAPMRALVCDVRGLRFSRDESTARLLRTTFLRSLASSPAAIAVALVRYRTLLRHAEDAAAAGRTLGREAIRRFVGADSDQLVLWPLVGEPSGPVELEPADLPLLESLAHRVRAGNGEDPKRAALRQLLADRKPTLVFTASIATVEHLRRGLESPVAWCTGQAAGLDHAPVPREQVLSWFRSEAFPGNGACRRPALLIATDVAAEGLDLPLIERVVHYDLPWTAVRMEQRTGRALRLSSRHREVEVIRCLPPPLLARTLGQEGILSRKALLPATLGLDDALDAAWRVRARIAGTWQNQPGARGLAVVEGEDGGVVAGVSIRFDDGTEEEFVWARSDRIWTDDPASIARLLAQATGAAGARPSTPWSSVAAGLGPKVAASLRSARGAVLRAPRRPVERALLQRLRRLAGAAAKQRHDTRLACLTRGIRHLRRGHTEGEARRIVRWMALPDRVLLIELARIPPDPPARLPVSVSLTSILVVEARG